MVRPALLADLRLIVGADGVIDRPEALLVYECDGYTLARTAPEVVVLPHTPAEVAAVLRLLAAERISFVPRGAGTGLSGGTLPVEAPVMVGTSRLTAIEAIDVANRRIVAQAGVVNQWVTNAVRAHGLCYAPDPSSQPACTIGGNIAENSGGPHTLKYGVTTNHVLGVELVLASGQVVTLGGQQPQHRRDLRGRARQHDDLGRRALERVAVALVDEERLGAVDDAVGADDATQAGEERGPHHVAFLLAPAFRRVQRERERGQREDGHRGDPDSPAQGDRGPGDRGVAGQGAARGSLSQHLPVKYLLWSASGSTPARS